MMEPVVTIKQGQLRGTIEMDIEGENYFSFKGIPYAKPPIGNLRFKAPVPADNWTGTFDATKEGMASYSKSVYSKVVEGSENCLFLNVFTKKLPDKTMKDLLPVMFWIYGGGYTRGSSTTMIYGPDFLITENLVIVSLNYRLGLLGFLSCEDPTLDVPGNAGIKDVVMALRWVQENISMFGGDPGNVTIFGQSSGAATVHLLMLSPITKGLFHKAIAQSASALCPGHEAQLSTKHIAEAIGRSDMDEKSLLQYLTNLPVEKIIEIQNKIPDRWIPAGVRPFGPVVEKGGHEFTILSQKPIDIILSGNYNKVPLMTGYTTAEGMIFRGVKNYASFTDLETIVPVLLGYKLKSRKNFEILDKVKEEYFGKLEISSTDLASSDDLRSDTYFVYGVQAAARNHAITSTAPVYLYRMSIESSLNFFKNLAKLQLDPGVCHSDDLGYLFKNFATPEIVPGSLEQISIKRFVKLWANFARYGNPTPEKNILFGNIIWEPVNNVDLNFLDIGEKLTVGVNPDAKRMMFWNDIFKNSPDGNKIILS